MPHPDHIDLDMRTGRIVVDGPFTSKQRDAGHRLIEHLIDNLDESEWLGNECKRTRNPERCAIYDAQIEREGKHRDKLLGRVLEVPWVAREWAKALRKHRTAPAG